MMIERSLNFLNFVWTWFEQRLIKDDIFRHEEKCWRNLRLFGKEYDNSEDWNISCSFTGEPSPVPRAGKFETSTSFRVLKT